MIITKETTYSELLNYMNNRPEMIRKTGGKDKTIRRIMIARMRENQERIAFIAVGKCKLEVFANGYAIYDKGNRKTVIWVPDGRNIRYSFTPLREYESLYMNQRVVIPKDMVGNMQWYLPLIVRGENQIGRNMERPKTGKNASDRDAKFCDESPKLYWACPAYIDGPEEAYLKKEAREERMKNLTAKQREAYELYYEAGYKQKEISTMLGINHRAVGNRLKGARMKIFDNN